MVPFTFALIIRTFPINFLSTLPVSVSLHRYTYVQASFFLITTWTILLKETLFFSPSSTYLQESNLAPKSGSKAEKEARDRVAATAQALAAGLTVEPQVDRMTYACMMHA